MFIDLRRVTHVDGFWRQLDPGSTNDPMRAVEDAAPLMWMQYRLES
jgi:hypothetical protein